MKAGVPFRLVPMEEEHAREICTWRYDPPYDLYNWKNWEEMQENGEEFADPFIRKEQYRAVLDEHGQLAGFAQFFPMVGVTRLGLGMKPQLCGSGSGTAFVRAIAREAVRLNPGHEIDLEVLVWNERAQRAYEKAGFRRTDAYERLTPTGPADFYCMVYEEGEAV
ncbi:GNAT family N-acetyltransferase [Paenibacillus sp. CC-CFT747]|nr:GNAT family N-acetyltransferase [Paenibacillus sp. CC-CFT747]